MEIHLLVAPLQEASIQHELHVSLVAEEGQRRCAALPHFQFFQHGVFISKPQVSAANAQFFGKLVQVDLPVVQDGHQPEAFLLLVSEEQVFAVPSLQVLDVGHHLLNREHLRSTTSVV